MSYNTYPPSMRRLINEFTKLPSIGEKTATRLAYHVIVGPAKDSIELSQAIQEALQRVQLCELCFGLTEGKVCSICGDLSRKRSVICAVEKPSDIIALERTKGFGGVYHVLHGLWSPLRGITPERTQIGSLIRRIEKGNENGNEDANGKNDDLYPKVEELLIATSTTVEGDATAMYIANQIANKGILVTRIAQGLPKGGELEYADDITLGHALKGRRAIE